MNNEYKIFCWSLSIPGVSMGDSGEYHYLKVIARSEQEAKDLAVIHNPKAKQFGRDQLTEEFFGLRWFRLSHL